MNPLLSLLILLLAMTLGALFTGMETVALTANRIRIHRDETGWATPMRDVYRLLGITQTTVAAATIAQIACIVTAAIAADMLMDQVMRSTRGFAPRSLFDDFILLFSLTPLYIFFVRLLPKFYFSRNPESYLLSILEPVVWLPRLLAPPLRSLAKGVRRIFAGSGVGYGTSRVVSLSDTDLQEMLSASSHASRDLSLDKKMIYGLFRLEQTIVREIMQPLVNVATLSRQELTRENLLALGRVSGYTRIPVYTHRVFNMDGIISVSNVLRDDKNAPIDQFIETPFFVPETMHADMLLSRMIANDIDMAIVIDEYGGTVGVVSQEDVIEEIVGDIEDEFDPARIQVVRDEEGDYLVDGRMDIDDVNDRFVVHLPNEDFDTLGGFIYDQLARVPRVGDLVSTTEMKLEVTTMDGKRVERVKLTLLSKDPEEETSV